MRRNNQAQLKIGVLTVVACSNSEGQVRLEQVALQWNGRKVVTMAVTLGDVGCIPLFWGDSQSSWCSNRPLLAN